MSNPFIMVLELWLACDLLQEECGARCLIDQYVLAAVVYAQTILDSDEDLKQQMEQKYRVGDPHIAVFPELPIPLITVTCGNTLYSFHGVLDYGIGYISDGEYCL
jgi:hypothetical protein